jgi:hypothetical protein
VLAACGFPSGQRTDMKHVISPEPWKIPLTRNSDEG